MQPLLLTLTLDCAQSLLDEMNITDDNSERENAVENTTEKAPNVAETEQSDTVMLEDTNSNANPPAETTIQEESSPATDEVLTVDIVHD